MEAVNTLIDALRTANHDARTDIKAELIAIVCTSTGCESVQRIVTTMVNCVGIGAATRDGVTDKS